MKRVVHALCPRHADIIGEVAVGAEKPGAIAALALRVEMHDLAAGVHAGIGATGTDDVDAFIGDPCQRLLQTLLHPESGLLALPAIETRTVVFDAECDANRRYR